MSDVLAIVIGCLLVAAPAPALIAWLRKYGVAQEIRDNGPERHLQKAGTPTMGGVLIVASLSLTFLLVAGYLRLKPLWPGLLLIALTLAFAAIGLADDWLMIRHGRSLGLKARHKLLLQFVAAALFLWAVHGVSLLSESILLPFTGRTWLMGWAYFPFAAVLIVGMSNAVNLTDGLDGLAAGLVLICCAALGVVAGWSGDEATRLFCFAAAGACAGFLWFNVNPARIFMGDTGSLALGAAIGGIGVMLSEELSVLIIGVVFVVEALSVIAQVVAFKTTRRRIIRMSPLHHHFELGGWPENQVVVRFWIIAAIVAMAVLAARPLA